MELNWIDFVILGVWGVGLLFGLMWGALRIIFFAFSLGVTLALMSTSVPIFDGIVTPILAGEGASNTMNFMAGLVTYSLAIFVPFIVISILLAWPYGLIVKHINPFMNFGIGLIVGAVVGYLLSVVMLILFAMGSVDREKPLVYCQSVTAPYVYSGASPALELAVGWSAFVPDVQNWLIGLAPSLDGADPEGVITCGGVTA